MNQRPVSVGELLREAVADEPIKLALGDKPAVPESDGPKFSVFYEPVGEGPTDAETTGYFGVDTEQAFSHWVPPKMDGAELRAIWPDTRS